MSIEPAPKADKAKLEKMTARMTIYGDITQTARGAGEIEELLMLFGNEVPLVIGFLEARARTKGRQAMNPPAFYERDGSLYQPQTIEIDVGEVNKAPSKAEQLC